MLRGGDKRITPYSETGSKEGNIVPAFASPPTSFTKTGLKRTPPAIPPLYTGYPLSSADQDRERGKDEALAPQNIEELDQAFLQILNRDPQSTEAVPKGIPDASTTSVEITVAGACPAYFAMDNLVTTTSPVPVPGTAWLLTAGSAGLSGLRRKQRP